MILREMTEQDVVVIQSWPVYPEEFKDLDYALREAGWISEYLGKKATKIYVAEERGVLIGFTILSRDDAEGGSFSTEFRIALHPDILGQGAGEKLARMTIRKGFEELGFQRIYLIVRKSNILRAMDYAACVGMPVATIQHGADVLRHDGAPGFSFGISGGLSLRCDRNSGRAEQRRSHLGPGSAPGGDGDAGDALCQGDGD